MKILLDTHIFLWFINCSFHPSLRFKKVHPDLPIYSARISKSYRAVDRLDGDTVIWFWVDSQAEYDRLLSRL